MVTQKEKTFSNECTKHPTLAAAKTEMRHNRVGFFEHLGHDRVRKSHLELCYMSSVPFEMFEKPDSSHSLSLIHI